jgi:thioredoxin 1
MSKFIKVAHAYVFAAVLLLFSACSNGTVKLSPAQFADKINTTPAPQLVDTRTPEEFNKGYLRGAVNIDWRNDDFEKNIQRLDKDRPVFLYCLSDNRSGKAARKMMRMGFKEIYDLKGGIISWRSSGMAIAGMRNAESGMDRLAYNKLLKDKKIVLVDFYAPWCEPCKKMAPYLQELDADANNGLDVVRINTDKETMISAELKVDALPTLILYKNGVEAWKHTGYISKEDLLHEIEQL